jgi:hypothetical protein
MLFLGGHPSHMTHFIDKRTYLTEAALVVQVSCWPNADASRAFGHTAALAGRDAR